MDENTTNNQYLIQERGTLFNILIHETSLNMVARPTDHTIGSDEKQINSDM